MITAMRADMRESNCRVFTWKDLAFPDSLVDALHTEGLVKKR